MKRCKHLLVAACSVLALLFFALGVAACAGGGPEFVFDANGGRFPDGSTAITVTGEAGETLDEPPMPEREGFYFGGWTTGEAAEALPETFTDGQKTYRAVWSETPVTVALTFDANGGTFLSGDTTYTAEGAPGAAVSLPAPPSRTGYAFGGWAKKAGGDAAEISVFPSYPRTYFAVWGEAVLQERTLTLVTGAEGVSTETLKVREGTPLADLLASHKPADEDDLPFAGWYEGSEPVSSDAVMPGRNLTLVARYTAAYSYRLYLQAADGSYEEGQGGTGSALYGVAFNAADAIELPAHYRFDTSLGEPSTSRLGKDQTFTVYLARTRFTVTFEANHPAVHSDPLVAVYLYGGEEGSFPASPATTESYRFAGWAESADGAPVHRPGDPLAFVENGAARYYAVWDRAYTDFFGGDDLVFLPAFEEGKAYLLRGGREYEGTAEGDSFAFADGELTGRIFGLAHTFAYLRADMGGSYSLYDAHLDAEKEEATLTLDGYHSGTYSYVEGGRTVTRPGTYFAAGEEYFFGYSDATAEDAGFYFKLGENGGPVFSVKNSAEEGVYAQFITSEPLLSGDFYSGSYLLALDGYGNVLLADTEATPLAQGRYRSESYAEGYLRGTRLCEMRLDDFPALPHATFVAIQDDVMGAFLLEDSYAGVYEGSIGGESATLALDGFALVPGSAVLTVGSSRTEGAYRVRTSAVFGTVLDFYTVGDRSEPVFSRSFRLSEDAKPVLRFEPVDENFSEYLRVYLGRNEYGNQATALGVPVVVIYDTPYHSGVATGSKAALYGDRGDTLTLASEGYVSRERIGVSDLFFYTYHTLTPVAGMESAAFGEFTFLVTNYSMRDAYCLFEADGTKYYDLFRGADGSLLYHNKTVSPSMRFGSLYVTAEGETECGGMEILPLDFDDTFYTFTPFEGETFWFAVSDDGFERVDERPAEYILRDRKGSTGYSYISYSTDGRGNARYGAKKDEYGRPEEFVSGTYQRSGSTFAGEEIFTFTGGGVTMQYITMHVVSEDMAGVGAMEFDYYLVFEEETEGTYTNGEESYLRLDGFARHATYVSPAGSFEGDYTFDELERNTVRFVTGEGDEAKLFLLKIDTAAKTFEDVTPAFSVTAEAWELADSNYEPVKGYEEAEVVFRANGTCTLRNGSKSYQGTYTLLDDKEHLYELTLALEGGETVWNVQLVESYYYRLCVLFDNDLEGTYTAADLSQLFLDGYGYGSYTDPYGFVHEGYYTILTDKYLAFFFGESNAFFVAYDPEGKTFAFPDRSQYLGTYYSETFASVVFAEEGVYLDGYLYGFYAVEDGGMTVFVYDPYADSFSVDDTMPVPGGETYVYERTTYYRWTEEEYVFSGTLAFDDVGYSEKNVSATLAFTPNGDPLFETAGTLVIGDGTGEKTLPVSVMVLMDTVVTVRILDEYGFSYQTEICNRPGARTFRVQGGLVERVSFGDIIESGNYIYYGYYGFGSYAVGESGWNFAFDATDSHGSHIFSSVQKTFPAEYDRGEEHDLYGTMYEITAKGEDGYDYTLQFLLVGDDLTPIEPSEDGESGLLLVYAAFRTKTLDVTAEDGESVRLEIRYYVYANVFDFTAGTNDVFLYVKQEGEYRRVGYSESGSLFAEDGSWAVLVTPGGEASWLLEYTLADDGFITGAKVTQGSYAELLSEDERYLSRFFYVWREGTFTVSRVFGFGYLSGDYVYFYPADFVRGEEGWTAVTPDGVFTLRYFEEGESVRFSALLGSLTADLVYRNANGEGTITLRAGGTVALSVGGIEAEVGYDRLVQLTRIDRFGVLWAADFEQEGKHYSVRFFLDGESETFTVYSVGLLHSLETDLNVRVALLENVYADAPQFSFAKGEILGADLYEGTAEGESYLDPLLVTVTPDGRFVFYSYVDPDLGLVFGFRIEIARGADGLVEGIGFAQVGIIYDRDWLTTANMPFSAVVEDYNFVDGKNMGITKYTFYYYDATDSEGNPLIITVTDVEDRRQVAQFGSVYAPVAIYLVRGTAEDGKTYDVEYADQAAVSFEGGSMNSSVLYSVDRVARFDVDAEGKTLTVDVTQAYHVHSEYLAVPDLGALSFFSLYEEETMLQPAEGGITYDAETHTLTFVTEERTYTLVFETDGEGWFTAATVTVQ